MVLSDEIFQLHTEGNKFAAPAAYTSVLDAIDAGLGALLKG